MSTQNILDRMISQSRARPSFVEAESEYWTAHDARHYLAMWLDHVAQPWSPWQWHQLLSFMGLDDRTKNQEGYPRNWTDWMFSWAAWAIRSGPPTPKNIAELAIGLGLPLNRTVRAELATLARQRSLPLEQLMVEMVEAALPLALEASRAPQRFRRGRKWLKPVGSNSDDKPGVGVPVDEANLIFWPVWLRTELFRQIELMALGSTRTKKPIASAIDVERNPEPGSSELEYSPYWANDAELLQSAHEQNALGLLVDVASPRQIEIIMLLADGHSKAEVARLLGLATSTVRVQVARIKEKSRKKATSM